MINIQKEMGAYMAAEHTEEIIREVGKVLAGKREVIEKVLMAVYAGGHILLEDNPGVGKTTLALGLSRALGLDYRRVQFTPDTMPSDVVGFSVYNRESGEFEYKSGAVNCHLFLGDELNRTSARTQAALLEVMEERAVTVDGVTYPVPDPFICIGTENPLGAAGTQPLPESQLDRFMIRLSIGYPDTDTQIRLMEEREQGNPLDSVSNVLSAEELKKIQKGLSVIATTREMYRYMTVLCEQTREDPMVLTGVSPRGILALAQMAKACACVRGRDYVVPEDVREVFADVCAHRLILTTQAKIDGVRAEDILNNIRKRVEAPAMG